MRATNLSASTLIGEDVRNSAGESLGEIKDLVIDTSQGRVVYAVVSFGGFLGIGDKYFAVPLQAMTLDTENHQFIFDVAKDRLEKAPGFDKNNWPSTTDQEWVNKVYSYYDTPSYYKETRAY